MANFKVHYGTKEHIDQKPLHLGYAYFTPEDGHFYIDGKVNGEVKRICLNPMNSLQDLYKHYPSKYEFPNIGEPNYIYVDESNGDCFLFGVNGPVYTSLGTASGDIICGGDSTGSNGGIE
jgi:hypothetical protein